MGVTTQAVIELDEANSELRALSAEDRVRWAVDLFGDAAVLLSSMQKTASVLMHIFYRLGLDNEILFVDTGFHFHDTLRMRDSLMRLYKLNVVTVYPELTPEQQEKRYGRKLHMFQDGYGECCRLRKEEPFLSYVRQHERRLVMVGARLVDGGRRAKLPPLARDPRIDGFALHPIFDWTDEQVADYVQRFHVPVHPLHAQSYPSIGCACCTTPVMLGEDPRAGRWRHLQDPDKKGPVYCGINFTDGSGI